MYFIRIIEIYIIYKQMKIKNKFELFFFMCFNYYLLNII